MGFKGTWKLLPQKRVSGIPDWGFILKNTNLLLPETIDYMVSDEFAQKPWYIRDVKLQAGRSYIFNFDTIGWGWCQHDFFAIIDKQNRILKKWQLNLKEYAPGECPECHGSHRCSHCQGRGYTEDQQHNMEQCRVCHGTGVCQTCYVPTRNGTYNNGHVQYGTVGQQVGGQFQGPTPDEGRQRRIAAIQSRIADLTSKIEKAEWDARMMQLKGLDVSAKMAYMSQVNLKFRYEKQLLDAQNQLRQLQNM